VRANATSSVPEWRKPGDQDPNPRQRKPSTREGNRGNKRGRGGGRGGNAGGPSRKDPTPASQDTAAPAPKLVVDPPTATNTPPEPSPTTKPNSRPKAIRRHSAAVSEDSTSVSSQTSARPPNRRKRSQQGRPSTATPNTPSKLLNVQTLNRKASTGPSSPNLAKDLPPHLATADSTPTPTELKSDIDALVERVRAVAMDRPHTPGSHIDWADDDDSLPDLNEWGYTEGVAAPVKAEEPLASIPPILEDAPLQSVIPEVKIEGEPSPDATQSQDGKLGPVPDATPRTHKVQKTRSKRGTRSRGNSRTQQLPPALNLADSVSQSSSLSPIQPTTATTIPHTSRPQGPKRQNSNQGQNPRNNQGQANSRDNNGSGNGGGRQRGQNGAAVASPMRNSFPAKTGPKADHTPPVQSRPPAQDHSDIAHSVTNPSTEPDPRPVDFKGKKVPEDEGKLIPIETPRNTDTDNPNPNPTATNPSPHELEPARTNVKHNSYNQNNKRNSYNPSHTRSHTYGGRTQGGPPPPHSAPTPSFPHHSSNNNPTSPNSQNPRSPNSRHSPGVRSSGLGPTPRSLGYERHNRNHSSPPGVGGATRPPHLTRPVLTGDALSRLARSLGSAPGSPKRDPPVPPPAS